MRTATPARPVPGGQTRVLKRLLGSSAIALALVTTSPPVPALAHASLVETTPLDGQQLDTSPEQITLTFNEPINAPTGGLRVFDSTGARVDAGIQNEITSDSVSVQVDDPLDDDGYVATYRVVSEDGHVIRGAFTFQVGVGSAIDGATLASLFAGGSDSVLVFVAGLARAVTYAGVLLLAGASLWLLCVARSTRDRELADRWAGRAAWAAVGATLAAVPLQAVLSSGLGVAALSNPVLLGETVRGSVGVAAVLRLLVLGGFLLTFRTRPRFALTLGGAALLTFLIDGHTRTVEPTWVVMAGTAVHLATAAAWGAGLMLLLLSMRQRRLDDDPVGAAALVVRFSRVATWSVPPLIIAGTAMAWANVRQVRALTTTDYGWTLLTKVAVVALIGLVGLYNRRVLVPAVAHAARPPAPDPVSLGPVQPGFDASTPDPDVRHPEDIPAMTRAAWTRLGTTVRFEAIGILVVLATTAFLVNLRPAADEAGITGAFDTYVQVTDELAVNLVVDPNRVGFNEIHMYVFDRSGRPLSSDDLDGLTLELSLPERDLGPIVRTPFVAGPGHWQVDGRDLAIPGQWEITVQLDIDRFTREEAVIPVVVNS